MGKVWLDDVEIGTFDPQTQGTSGNVLVNATNVGTFTLGGDGYVYANSTVVGTYVASDFVGLPVVALAFGGVTPPQGDVLDLKVHLGCTKEVSSFDCLLQNFNKKYSPGETNAINVGDNGSISIGRGVNCPLILTGRVEEIEPQSAAVENYIRVRGRCCGEKIFRRVVTKIYENQKGEAIVKDLLDNYVGLSHTRNGTELVEDTDTTYTLLEYENTPVFDILKYIAATADKAGVIGFDFRVEPDGKFAFFPKNSKSSPVSLSERIEVSSYHKDIHRIRNKIYVYGAAGKPYPLDVDGQPWSDSLTESVSPAEGDWTIETGDSVTADSAKKMEGSYSIKGTKVETDRTWTKLWFTFDAGKEVNSKLYPKFCFSIWLDSIFREHRFDLVLYDDQDKKAAKYFLRYEGDQWIHEEHEIGEEHTGDWIVDSGFDWTKIKKVRFSPYCANITDTGSIYIDRMYFFGHRWAATEEDSSSQTSYGLRELSETNEELYSDNECELRAKALLAQLKDPAEYLTLRSTIIDYYVNQLLPADKIPVTLPNENVDSDYRIINSEYHVVARDQTLEITLELGKEKPLLADYLYGLRAEAPTLESLARMKGGAR